MGLRNPLLRQKQACSGHVTRHDYKTILQGAMDGGRYRCQRWICWTDNVKEWTSRPTPELLKMPSPREDWKRISAESSLMSLLLVLTFSPLFLFDNVCKPKHVFFSPAHPLLFLTSSKILMLSIPDTQNFSLFCRNRVLHYRQDKNNSVSTFTVAIK